MSERTDWDWILGTVIPTALWAITLSIGFIALFVAIVRRFIHHGGL